jgi:hypothetical protein
MRPFSTLSGLLITSPLAVLAQAAIGQFTPVDQTRTLAVLATGSVDPGGLGSTGPNSQNGNTVTTIGTYNDSETAAKDYIDTSQSIPVAPGNPNYHAHASASQNSLISTTALSGNIAAGADASMLPDQGIGYSVEGRSTLQYVVDFTVPTETFILINGSVAATGTYHLGRLEQMQAQLNLVGSASGSIYSTGGSFFPGSPFGINESDPFSFSTLLEPGQIYTLTATSMVDALRPGSSIEGGAPATADVNFTLAVPEPTSFIIVLIGAIFLLNQRRNGLRQPLM